MGDLTEIAGMLLAVAQTALVPLVITMIARMTKLETRLDAHIERLDKAQHD